MKNTKPYDNYKPSGITWLGEIPQHWEVRKLKFVLYLQRGHDLPKDNFIEGNFPVFGSNGIIGFHNEYTTKSPCITIGRSGSVGKINFIKKDFWAHNTCLFVKQSNGNDWAYLWYLLNTIDIKMVSNTTAVPTLDRKDVHELFIAYAPLSEQITIARFLDYKLNKIDRFILKKKKLIQLLNEQKAAIINDAVTKGLDPSVKMKDSGVEWLGDIPEHWKVRKLKYVADCFPSNIDKHLKEDEKSVRLCNYTDVYKNDFITNNMNLMIATATDDQIKKFTLLKGDVIITKDSETANDIAVPALVNEDLENVVCGYHLSVLRPTINLQGDYLFRALQCKPINIQFEVCSNGVTRVGLGVYDLKKAKIPIPLLEEQKAIVSHTEKETATLNQAIATIEKEIALVQEYRTTLIAEAVTGKIQIMGNEQWELDNEAEELDIEGEMGLDTEGGEEEVEI